MLTQDNEPTADRAADPAQAAVAALGATPAQRGAVLLYERTGGRACMCGRICMRVGAYFIVSNTARVHVHVHVHVMPVLTAVARVGYKRAPDRRDDNIFGSCKRYSDI